MKFDVKFIAQFKKDLKLAKQQNKDIDKLYAVIETLAEVKPWILNSKSTNLPETTKARENAIQNLIGC